MIKPAKRAFLRIFFAFEVLLFLWTYFFGAHGIYVLRQAGRENKRLTHEINLFKHEIEQFEDILARWERYPFFKEKHAREQLQMARETDEIYYLS